MTILDWSSYDCVYLVCVIFPYKCVPVHLIQAGDISLSCTHIVLGDDIFFYLGEFIWDIKLICSSLTKSQYPK